MVLAEEPLGAIAEGEQLPGRQPGHQLQAGMYLLRHLCRCQNLYQTSDPTCEESSWGVEKKTKRGRREEGGGDAISTSSLPFVHSFVHSFLPSFIRPTFYPNRPSEGRSYRTIDVIDTATHRIEHVKHVIDASPTPLDPDLGHSNHAESRETEYHGHPGRILLGTREPGALLAFLRFSVSPSLRFSLSPSPPLSLSPSPPPPLLTSSSTYRHSPRSIS